MRSLPEEQVGRRCEQLMKAAEKEIEQLEKDARDRAGLPTEAGEGEKLPPIELPRFRVIQDQIVHSQQEKIEREKKELESKVHDLASQIQSLQNRIKSLNEVAQEPQRMKKDANLPKVKKAVTPPKQIASPPVESKPSTSDRDGSSDRGAPGPDGNFVDFPDYDGKEPPKESKKPFTHFCNHTRRSIKESLDPSERKNKAKVNSLLKESWIAMKDEDKEVWRLWAEWDIKRFERDSAIFSKVSGVKRKVAAQSEESEQIFTAHVPKKTRKN